MPNFIVCIICEKKEICSFVCYSNQNSMRKILFIQFTMKYCYWHAFISYFRINTIKINSIPIQLRCLEFVAKIYCDAFKQQNRYLNRSTFAHIRIYYEVFCVVFLFFFSLLDRVCDTAHLRINLLEVQNIIFFNGLRSILIRRKFCSHQRLLSLRAFFDSQVDL